MATLASEWTKVRSLRSSYVMLVAAVTLSIGFTVLVAFAFSSSYDTLEPQEQADFDPVLFSFTGLIISGVVFIAFGAWAVTSEYASGMIRLTFTITPQRGRVWFAKLIVIALASFLVGNHHRSGELHDRSSDLRQLRSADR